MNEYPKYFPPFMREFHDLKNVSKAFFVWLDMMDNRQEQLSGEGKRRRNEMCNWIDFSVLMASFIDFLNVCGYRIYKARGREAVDDSDLESLAKLPLVWSSLVNPDQPLSYTDEWVEKEMHKWIAFFDFMPEEVKAAWLKKLNQKS